MVFLWFSTPFGGHFRPASWAPAFGNRSLGPWVPGLYQYFRLHLEPAAQRIGDDFTVSKIITEKTSPFYHPKRPWFFGSDKITVGITLYDLQWFTMYSNVIWYRFGLPTSFGHEHRSEKKCFTRKRPHGRGAGAPWGTMHVTGKVAGSIGVGCSTILLHKLMVLTWLKGSAEASKHREKWWSQRSAQFFGSSFPYFQTSKLSGRCETGCSNSLRSSLPRASNLRQLWPQFTDFTLDVNLIPFVRHQLSSSQITTPSFGYFAVPVKSMCSKKCAKPGRSFLQWFISQWCGRWC